MASRVPKVCEKTNEDRNVIPKAAKSWVIKPESAPFRPRLALKLLPKKPTRTFERSEIVKFGAPPKIFFQNFRKIFPNFLVLLELRFYLRSFSRSLSAYGGLFKNILLNKKKFRNSTNPFPGYIGPKMLCSSDLAQFEKKILTFLFFTINPYRPRGTEAAAAATFLLRGRPEKKIGPKVRHVWLRGGGGERHRSFFLGDFFKKLFEML